MLLDPLLSGAGHFFELFKQHFTQFHLQQQHFTLTRQLQHTDTIISPSWLLCNEQRSVQQPVGFKLPTTYSQSLHNTHSFHCLLYILICPDSTQMPPAFGLSLLYFLQPSPSLCIITPWDIWWVASFLIMFHNNPYHSACHTQNHSYPHAN